VRRGWGPQRPPPVGEFTVRLDTIVKVATGLDMTVAALCEKAKI
jgi:hypothetical protein